MTYYHHFMNVNASTRFVCLVFSFIAIFSGRQSYATGPQNENEVPSAQLRIDQTESKTESDSPKIDLQNSPSEKNIDEDFEDLKKQLKSLNDRLNQLERQKTQVIKRPFQIGLSGELFVVESAAGEDAAGSNRLAESQLFRLSPLFDFELNHFWRFHSRLTFFNGGSEVHRAGTDQKGATVVERAFFEYRDLNFSMQFGHIGLPFGFFNQRLDPQSFYGVRPSELETQLLPGPWNESGLWSNYRWQQFSFGAGAFTSLNARNFTNDEFLRGGRQNSQSALTEDLFYVGRFEYLADQLSLGATYGQGNVNQQVSFLPTINLKLIEVFAKLRWRSFFFEALVVQARLSQAEALALLSANQTFGSSAEGVTATAGYQILLRQHWGVLEAFYQLTSYDLNASVPLNRVPNSALNRQRNALGLQYAPRPEILLKADYLWRSSRSQDERDQARFSLGFLF